MYVITCLKIFTTKSFVFFFIVNSSTEAYDQESDDEFCDAEIKFRPETVRFIPDESDGSEDEKMGKRRKEEDLITLTSRDGQYPAHMLRYIEAVVGSPSNSSPADSPGDLSPVDLSPVEKVHYFGDGWETRDDWYDCTLGTPVSREVRDSYDQFCKTSNDNGSRDSLNKSHQGKRLYEQMGSKVFLVSKFDSNTSLQGYSTLKHPRFKAVREGGLREEGLRPGMPRLPKTDPNFKYARQQPHHWSTPAVFTRHLESRNNREGSDSDSVDSVPRDRRSRRAVRPHSLYGSNSLATRAELKPITEQDSDPKLRCVCEDDDDSDEVTCRFGGPKNSEDSSYLHLDRSESNRLSFVEQLKSWDGGSDDSLGKPYDSHDRRTASAQPVEATERLGSDSENSISPAHSLVSLSESESDGEIGRKLHGSDGDVNRLSVVGESDKVNMYRAVSYLKSMDSESSSDDQLKGISPPPGYKDKRIQSVTNLDLSSLQHADSLDELKACDPFYTGDARDSRSPSNASSGFCSIQVSSSETNSAQESPRESIKRTSRSSGSSRSSGYSSVPGSLRSSLESKGEVSSSKLELPGKLNTSEPRDPGKLPKHDEPYEWDPSSSELEELESEGSSYNPKAFENLLDLQRQLGVDLEDSGSSRGSLDKLSTSELLKYSPPVSPTKYKVDKLSDAEKNKRCSKLMQEYKTTRKIKNEIAAGSSIYRTWVL